MVVASSMNNVIRFSYNYGVNWNTINIVNPWSTIGLSPVGDLIVTGDYNTNTNGFFKLTTFFPTSLNAGNVTFNVSSWSNYSIGEGMGCVGANVGIAVINSVGSVVGLSNNNLST
jgi:hypothetical protein